MNRIPGLRLLKSSLPGSAYTPIPHRPRIDFLLIQGTREVSLKKISNRDVLLVGPYSDTMSSGESAQFDWNRARIHYD